MSTLWEWGGDKSIKNQCTEKANGQPSVASVAGDPEFMKQHHNEASRPPSRGLSSDLAYRELIYEKWQLEEKLEDLLDILAHKYNKTW